MVKFIISVAALLVAPSLAFAPVNTPQVANPHVLNMVADKQQSKRKRALKTLGKVAKTVSTAALFTAGAAPAFAAKETVQAVDNTRTLIKVGAGALAAGAAFVQLNGEKK